VAELTLRLVVDPATGRREIVVDYRSDPDALPEEHEEAHRRLAEALGATEREPSTGSRSQGSAAIAEPVPEPEGQT
jgi:hypothetical protein